MDWRGMIIKARGLGGMVAVAALLGVPAAVASAATTVSLPAATTSCPALSLIQPFAAVNDLNFYSLMPGEAADSFGGAGWTLSGGARIITTKLADGRTGSVLDLPSGSKAVSPMMCVTSDFPVARMMVRDVAGSEGVFFNVSYLGTNTANNPKNTGQVHGNQTAWTLSDPVNMQPNNVSGWQQTRVTLVAGGKTSDFQVYDLYVDPRCA